jgi:hypothetical protein
MTIAMRMRNTLRSAELRGAEPGTRATDPATVQRGWANVLVLIIFGLGHADPRNARAAYFQLLDGNRIVVGSRDICQGQLVSGDLIVSSVWINEDEGGVEPPRDWSQPTSVVGIYWTPW